MADNNDGKTTTIDEPETNPQGGTPAGGADEGNLVDKHGEPAISKGRYNREMQAKDAEIAALKAQLEDAGKQAKTGEDALKEVQQLKEQLADERVTSSLEIAGCVNAKAAKALLDDYDGDVAKLKEACPYLFRAPQTGSTGARPGGAPAATSEQLKARAKEAAEGKLPTIRR